MPRPNIKLRSKPGLKSKPAVQRVRDPLTFLSSIIKDERTAPRHRLLAASMAMYFGLGVKHGKAVPMNEQDTTHKKVLQNIILTQFGNARLIMDDNGDVTAELSLPIDPLKAMLDGVLNGKSEEECNPSE